MDIIPSGDIVTFNLQEQNLLEFDITYNIRVVALNNNGDSNHSNVIQYTRVGGRCRLLALRVTGYIFWC
jgi:hypothetical protein